MYFGEREDRPHTSCKAPAQPRVRGGLVAGSAGIMPSAQHSGLGDVAPRPSSSPRRYSMRAGLSSAPQHPHARRHLDPHHFTNLSDDAKRAEGRLRRAHVAASEQQKRADAYYASGQPTVAQPPGSECNLYLKSYYYTPLSKADSTSPPPRQTAGFRANAQSTSFQLSEARLRQIKREHPHYEEQAARALQQQHGDYSIVPTEQKLSRRVAVEEYAEGSEARVAQIAASTKFHGPPDLGSPTPAIERSVPYAVGDACAPRADTQVASTSHVRHYPNRGRSSTPTEPSVRPCDRHHFDGPAPYDSTSVSGSAYPTPPAVGEQRSLFSKPTLVHMDERRLRDCVDDVDSLALKRARARSGPAVSEERQDFIFGPEPALPTRQPTLRHRTEARWKAQERHTEERRTGRALYPQSYQSTSLW
ncbi:hypothetical protein NESM_000603600 [Novymonas esmeraldas]|uniref:Uncharacterized protein n=1 Tax=Novymonas esmeraldas TaxID=1808958 RepID=A0AAW0EU76_9TRYP